MLQLEERGRPKELLPPHIKPSRGEYQAQRCKNEHDTNLPLLRSILIRERRCGSPPQLWEERSAEELRKSSRQTSRGEFRM
jgi:hypothetical protein